MYFSGANTEVFKGKDKLDLVEIQFSSDQTSSPLYGPGDQLFQTSMNSSVLIQGSFTLNFTEESKDLNKLLMDESFDLFIYNSNSELSKSSTTKKYEEEGDAHLYIIYNVNVVAITHSIQPTPNNIVEVFHFIAKTFEEIIPENE